MKGANMQCSAGNLEYIELTPADEDQELQNPGVQRYESSVCDKTMYRCARDDSVYYYYYLKDGRVNHGLNITSNLYSLYRDGEIVFQAPLSQDNMELITEIRESTDNPIIADQFIVRKLRLHQNNHEIGNYNDLPPFETQNDGDLVADIFEPEKLDDFPKAETLRQRTIEVFAQALRQQIEENIALGYVQIPETTLPYCREWILTELCEKRGYTVTLDDKLRW